MIANVTKGRDFARVLEYAMQAKKDPVLVGGTAGEGTAAQLAESFAAACARRPGVAKPVWHCSLSLPPGESAGDAEWNRIAERFMEEMGFPEGTDYVAVRHRDTGKDHVHVIACRVNAGDGSLWSDSNDFWRASAACARLEEEFGLAPAPRAGKPARRPLSRKQIQRSIREGTLSCKEGIQDAVDWHLDAVSNGFLDGGLPAFALSLASFGIDLRVEVDGAGGVAGISYLLDGKAFKGSSLGARYGWGAALAAGIASDPAKDLAAMQEALGLAAPAGGAGGQGEAAGEGGTARRLEAGEREGGTARRLEAGGREGGTGGGEGGGGRPGGKGPGGLPPVMAFVKEAADSLLAGGGIGMDGFVRGLRLKGVEVTPSVSAKGRLSGLRFGCGPLSFKGSAMGSGYGLGKLLGKGLSYDPDAVPPPFGPLPGRDGGEIPGAGEIQGGGGLKPAAASRPAPLAAVVRAGLGLGPALAEEIQELLAGGGIPLPLFMDAMEAAGARVLPNLKGTGRVLGIAFEVDGARICGSAVGHGHGWPKLLARGLSYDPSRDEAGVRERLEAAAERERERGEEKEKAKAKFNGEAAASAGETLFNGEADASAGEAEFGGGPDVSAGEAEFNGEADAPAGEAEFGGGPDAPAGEAVFNGEADASAERLAGGSGARDPGGRERSEMLEETKQRLRVKISKVMAAKRPMPLPEFITRLRSVGVKVVLNLQSTGNVTGVTFGLGDEKAAGSELGRTFGWAGLVRRGLLYDRELHFKKAERHGGAAYKSAAAAGASGGLGAGYEAGITSGQGPGAKSGEAAGTGDESGIKAGRASGAKPGAPAPGGPAAAVSSRAKAFPPLAAAVMAGADLKEELRAAISKVLEGRKIALPDFMDLMAAWGAEVTPNIRSAGNVAGLKFEVAGIRVNASDLGRGWSWGGLADMGIVYDPAWDEAGVRARLARRGAAAPPGPEAPPVPPSMWSGLSAAALRFGVGIKRVAKAAISKVLGFLARPVSFFGFARKMGGEGVGVEPLFGEKGGMADVRYSAGGESVLGSGLGQGYDLPGIKAKGVADVGRDEWGAAKEPLSFGAEEGRAGGEAGGSRLGPGRPGGGDGGGGSLSGRPGGRDPGDPAHLGSGAERAPGRSGLADGGGLVPAPGKGRGPRPGLLRRNPAEPGGGLQDGGAPGAALGAGAGPPAAGKGRLCPRFPGPGHDFARLRDAGRPGGGTVEAPGRGLREGGGPGGRDRLRLCEVWDPGRAELPGFAAEERGGDAWYLPEGGGGPSFVDRGFYVDCLGDSDGELSASLRLAQDKWGGVAPCGPPAFLARCWKLARLGGVNLWLAPGPPFFPPRGLEPALGNEGALLFVFGSLADALVSAEGAGSKPALCGGPDFAGAFAAIGGYLGGAGPGATAAVLFGPGPGGTGGAGAAFGCLFDMGSDAGLSAALRLGAGTGRSVSLRGPDEFLLRGWRLARERGVPLAETPELGIALGRAPSGARPTGLERRSPALAPGRFGRPREFAPVPGPFPARSSPYPPAAPEQVPAPRTAAPRRQLRPRDPAPAPGPYPDPDPGPGPGPGFRGPGGGPGM